MVKIFINPGHCPGIDPGATNKFGGPHEAEIAKLISEQVGKILQNVGYEIKILQSNDLAEIYNTCNAWGADALVSIHCNSFGSEAANGTETLYHAGSVKGGKLADCINNQIRGSITVNGKPITNRGAKTDTRGLAVIRGSDCPAVLVETAFLSNPDEEKILSSSDGQYSFAAAIARGVTDYWAAV